MTNRYLPKPPELGPTLPGDALTRRAPHETIVSSLGVAAPRLTEHPLGADIDSIMGAIPAEREAALRSSKSRSVQFTPVHFGNADDPTHASLGFLQDDGIDYQARTIYLQCDMPGVFGFGGVVAAGIADATPQPLFPVCQIDFGAHGMTQRLIVDVPVGSLIRVPMVASQVKLMARILKPVVPTITGDLNLFPLWQSFNNPPTTSEGFPVVGFFMRAFVAEGIIGSNPIEVIRKVQPAGGAPGAGTQVVPTANGAYAVKLIGDSTKLTFDILQELPVPAGVPVIQSYGPYPANTLIELPSGAVAIAVIATGAAFWEIENYLAVN